MTPAKRSRVQIPLRHSLEARAVPIVADGIVATAAIGEGRNIPLLILDTSSRPDIDAMVRAHEVGPGDVTSFWSFKERWPRLPSPLLVLKTTKPSDCVIAIEFDMIKRRGTLVDQILWAQCLYLQPGRPGDRVRATLDRPRLLVEIPANQVFGQRFRRVYEKALFKEFRALGMNRRNSKQAVQDFLKRWSAALHRALPFQRDANQTQTTPRPPRANEDTTGSI